MSIHRTIVKLAASIILVFGAAAELHSQDWFWKNPLPQGNDIHALCSAGSGVLYAVGDFGTVIKSTNAGSNWFIVETPTTINLYGIFFTAPDRVTVVGDAGTILQTTNGGISWSERTIAQGATLYGISFSDALTGTVVGYPGIVLRTTDGGSTWQQQLAGGGDHLYAVQFIDSSKGIVVGSDGVIFRTTNAGRSWGRQVDSTTRHLFGVSFPDSMNGFAVGEVGLILHTSDGGKTWKSRPSGTSYPLHGVSFLDSMNGVVVGESSTILTTTDGGATWAPQSTGIAVSLTSIVHLDASTAVAVGLSGVALKTANGGSSWTKQTLGFPASLYGVTLLDPSRGIAVGYRGMVITTNDRGASWVSRSSGVTDNLLAIASYGSDTAVAVGENGTIIRTEDGGSTWTNISLPPIGGSPLWLSGIAFSPSGNALIVGKMQAAPLPFSLTVRSTNGGRTWTPSLISFVIDIDRPRLYFHELLNSVGFVDTNVAVSVGENGRLVRTTNAGLKWDTLAPPPPPTPNALSKRLSYPLPSQTLNSVAFSKSRIGVGTAVGGGDGTVLHTTDGGLSWNVLQILGQNLRSISYGDTTFAMAVGDNGRMFHTSNGGKSWSTLSFLGTNRSMVLRTAGRLNGVSLSGGNILLVGDGGTILGREGPDIPVSAESVHRGNIPTSPVLRQNYPNPFNPETTIEFHVDRSGPVHLAVYDLLGRRVATLVDEMKSAGVYRVRWNAQWFPTGTYIVRLHQGDLMLSRRMLLIR